MEKPNITLHGFIAAGMPPKTERAPDYQNVYCNAVRSGVSPWDIRMIFSEVIETADHSQAVQDKTTVIMSPQQAKAALHVLQTSIQSYELIFGPIADITSVLDKAKAETSK
ncbi:MAG: DUF3467 domain-containing protein [Steroidobacteraceae bacterium]